MVTLLLKTGAFSLPFRNAALPDVMRILNGRKDSGKNSARGLPASSQLVLLALLLPVAAMLTSIRQRAAAAAAAAASVTSALLLNSPAQAECGASGPHGSARISFADQPRGACPPLTVLRAIVLTRHGDRTPAGWADSRSKPNPAFGNQSITEAEARFWKLNNASLIPSADAKDDWGKYCPVDESNFPSVTGTLTWLGAATQHANGVWLRERYIHQYPLLPETLADGVVLVNNFDATPAFLLDFHWFSIGISVGLTSRFSSDFDFKLRDYGAGSIHAVPAMRSERTEAPNGPLPARVSPGTG